MMTTKLTNQFALVTHLVIVVACELSVQGAVQFKFNTPQLAISEGGNLQNELSIVKIGQNQMDISFQVRVIPGTAFNITDYRANNEDSYIFTSSTRQLPIRTQLVGDRAGEPIENFMICLPDSIMGAEIIEPRCVTITIVDDDSVVIGFRSSSEALVLEEGGTTTVCANVKPEGLRLDPFDRVPLAIQTNPAPNEVQLSTTSLLFENSITELCASVSVEDNDNMEGSRSYQLVLQRNGVSTVPVELYPNTLIIIVIDNDGPDATFSINSLQPNYTIQEGDRIENVRIQKSGNTVLSYNVSLMVTPLTITANEEDVVIAKYLLMNPSEALIDVGPIEIRDDSMSEGRKVFNISIGTIEENSYGIIPSVTTAVRGDPVKIIAYDNDYEVGFDVDNSDITLTKGASGTVCVKILDLQPSDIYPMANIPLTISINTISTGCIELEANQVVLNSVNTSRCVMVTVANDIEICDDTKSASIQLTQIGSSNTNTNNSITLQKGNISITLQDRPTSNTGVEIALGIVISVLGITVTAVVIVLIIVCILRRKKTAGKKEGGIPLKSNSDANEDSGDQSTPNGSSNGNDTHQAGNDNGDEDSVSEPTGQPVMGNSPGSSEYDSTMTAPPAPTLTHESSDVSHESQNDTCQ